MTTPFEPANEVPGFTAQNPAYQPFPAPRSGDGPAPSVTYTPAAPTGTVNATTGVMMGLGSACTFTPTGTGKVRIVITGQVLNSAIAQVTVGARYGTGTPPANTGTVAGTRFGSGQAGGVAADMVTRVAAAALGLPFAFQQIVTGLAPNVPIWADLMLISNSGSNTVSVQNLCVSFEEMAV